MKAVRNKTVRKRLCRTPSRVPRTPWLTPKRPLRNQLPPPCGDNLIHLAAREETCSRRRKTFSAYLHSPGLRRQTPCLRGGISSLHGFYSHHPLAPRSRLRPPVGRSRRCAQYRGGSRRRDSAGETVPSQTY